MGILKDKVAIITGGSSGIGRAMAERFHAEGARVLLVDINGKQDAVAAEIGPNASGFQADVTKAADVKAMVDAAVERFGRLDILLNNAGTDGVSVSITEYPEEEYERVLAVNVRSVFLGMKYAIPVMRKNGGGAIVNTASTAGVVGFANMPAYCASKGAVVQLTRSAAMECAHEGIRINAVCPGPIRTDMTANIPADIMKAVVGRTPMARYGEPDEIAKVALFLASDLGSFVTGAVMLADGGLTAQ
ncbi:SDR family NAD(P)-dependent oxidoreductase [Aquisediminimonas sediminicola]|uniref:SDR family NAD(P)-dependent oxidoreductase n=1 Tax=Alteraquisediminimonas sediminicola TaxID=2676787 RepID=UPI001C8D6C3D|nr:SDR family oxidoreductase [Aquisediminimonas sediminicola]